jgi:hypothetical protein
MNKNEEAVIKYAGREFFAAAANLRVVDHPK